MRKKLILVSKFLFALSILYTPVGVSAENAIVKDSNLSIAQQDFKTYVGKIVDAKTGEAIIGANVKVKGSNTGTISDLDGNYQIMASVDALLEISYIGYESQTVLAKDAKVVRLQEDNKVLDEVVVVGYGTQKKVNLTGSVSSVSTEKIKDRVQSNVLSAVQGTVPGVTVISRPGQTPSINFRGRGNLGASSPLYVIDGAISDASFFSNLDPNSIESISFLKDAASSAIYGSRAAYGVVLVTTKEGKKDKMNVSYNAHVGIQTPTYLPDLVNSAEYATLYNEAKYNINPKEGKYQAYSEEEIQWFRDGSRPDYYPDTNWKDLVLDKHIVTTQHSLNLSGGSDKLRYYTSLGYLYRDNYIPNNRNDRYNLTTNLTSDINKWLTFKSSIKYIRNTSERTSGAPSLVNFLLVPSTMVAKHSNGTWGSIAGGENATQSFMQGNPLRALDKNDWNESKDENTMIDLGFDIKPIKGLVLSGKGVFIGNEYKGKSYTALQDNVLNFETGDEVPGTGIYTNKMDINWSSSTRMLYTGTALYNWTDQIHSFTGLLGTSYEHFKHEGLSAFRKNFPSDDLKDLEAGSSAGEDIGNGSSLYEYKMMSYFARFNYNYKQRYLFEANLRADASSRFHKDKRWGYFPSFSAGWRISEEPFLKQYTKLDNLKIRASWGTLGNINNVGNYDYFQSYASNSNYNFSDAAVKGISQARISNVNLGWETVALTDIGFDLSLMNGKFTVSADYYVKNTSDILLSYNVPRETGISSPPSQNIGSVRNTGLEMAFTFNNNYKDFTYQLGFNFSTNSNEIIDLAGSNNIISNGGDKIRFILREGESIGSFYGFKTNGLYSQEEIDNGEYYKFGRVPNAGDIKYVPQREGVTFGENITDDDRTIIGNDVPDFTYGLNINLGYKNFELSLMGQGVSGTSVAFESEQVSAFFLNSNPRKFHLKRWTVDNPNPHAVYPRIYGQINSTDNYNQYFSDYQLFDSDYFRIKTISLGYKFSQNIVKRLGLSNLKMFVTGENLLTLRADDKMEDFDPEASSGRGLGALGVKSIAFGLNVSF